MNTRWYLISATQPSFWMTHWPRCVMPILIHTPTLKVIFHQRSGRPVHRPKACSRPSRYAPDRYNHNDRRKSASPRQLYGARPRLMFRLIEPALGRVSGGLRYNHAVAAAAGKALTVQQLAGTWPDPTANDVAALQQVVEHSDGPILLDGLIGCSLPSPVQASVPVVQLVHALAEDPNAQWREALNLRAASAVVTTSQFAADQLYRRHGIEAVAARPGVEPQRLTLGHDGSKLICVGAVEPNKNQLFL